jgi:hypothetical protein
MQSAICVEVVCCSLQALPADNPPVPRARRAPAKARRGLTRADLEMIVDCPPSPSQSLSEDGESDASGMPESEHNSDFDSRGSESDSGGSELVEGEQHAARADPVHPGDGAMWSRLLGPRHGSPFWYTGGKTR